MDQNQAEQADQNYVISTGLLTSCTIVGEFFDSFKMSIFNTGVANPRFNVMFIKQPTSRPEKLLEKGELFFRQRKLPFRVSFSHGLAQEYLSILKEKGYQENSPEPVMILNDLWEQNPYQNRIQIKKVVDETTLSHYQDIVEKAYLLPQGSGPFVITKSVLKIPESELFVGYVDGEHACASMLIKTGVVAGIYWVGTLKKFRNQGLAKAVVAQSVTAGYEKGCSFASLQASEMGKPVYESMGFDHPYSYENYQFSVS